MKVKKDNLRKEIEKIEAEFNKKFVRILVEEPKTKGMSTSIYPGVKCHSDYIKSFYRQHILRLIEKVRQEEKKKYLKLLNGYIGIHGGKYYDQN